MTVQDQKVLSKVKRLNAQKHTTQTKQQQLDELQREYQRMKAEAGGAARSADAHARRKEEAAMVGRALRRACKRRWRRSNALTCNVDSRSCEHKRTGWRRYSLNARRQKTSRLTTKRSNGTCRSVSVRVVTLQATSDRCIVLLFSLPIPRLVTSGGESDFPEHFGWSGGRNAEVQRGARQHAGPERRGSDLQNGRAGDLPSLRAGRGGT